MKVIDLELIDKEISEKALWNGEIINYKGKWYLTQYHRYFYEYATKYPSEVQNV